MHPQSAIIAITTIRIVLFVSFFSILEASLLCLQHCLYIFYCIPDSFIIRIYSFRGSEELASLLKVATPVSFGDTILRAETAAIYGVGVLKAWMDGHEV